MPSNRFLNHIHTRMSWFSDDDGDPHYVAYCCDDCAGYYDTQDEYPYWTDSEHSDDCAPVEIPTLVDLCVDMITANFEIGPELRGKIPQDLWHHFFSENQEELEYIMEGVPIFNEPDVY